MKYWILIRFPHESFVFLPDGFSVSNFGMHIPKSWMYVSKFGMHVSKFGTKIIEDGILIS
jgi:hypothetical protein